MKPAGITLLHADDFYKPDSQIPLHESTGFQNWDCGGALDLPRLRGTLLKVKEEGVGAIPIDLVKQGGVEDGVHATAAGGGSGSMIEGFIDRKRQEVAAWRARLPVQAQGRPIVLVEGFLLFGSGVRDSLDGIFDLKILVRASRAKAGERRERRNGYVTLEGFWADPPGYFEEVVWPGYEAEHGYLFRDQDVEGQVLEEAEREGGVKVQEGLDIGVEESCAWVLSLMEEALAFPG